MRRLRYSIFAIAALIAGLSVCLNYHESRQALLESVRKTYFYISQGAVSQHLAKLADSPSANVSLETLYQTGFQYFDAEGMVALIVDRSNPSASQSVGVSAKALADVIRQVSQPSLKQIETNDYLLYQVLSDKDKTYLLGFSKDMILKPAVNAADRMAIGLGFGLLLFILISDMLSRRKLENPLKQFFREGLAKSLWNVMQGVNESAKTAPKIPFLSDDIHASINHSFGMLKAWGQHKADIDQFIRASTMETSKAGLAASLYQILQHEMPLNGFSFYETNHSLNRMELVFIEPKFSGDEDKTLSTPENCFSYRTGADLSQFTGHQLCHGCEHAENVPYICKTLVAGGTQVGVCRFDIDAEAMAQRFDYIPDPQARLALLDTLLEPFVHLLALAVSNINLIEAYKNSAITDQLTGLYNRRYIIEYFTNILSLAKRETRTLSVFMADIDNFKRLNDEFGHKVGDLVLQGVARTMRDSIRESDTLGRYGGEEFIVILPDTDLEVANKVGEKMRLAVETIDWADYELPNIPKVTISIGIAQFPMHGYSHYHLTNSADKALYQAKRSGRNRVVTHKHLPDPDTAL